ncbi:hypothetical protein ACFVGM_08375 [Kitasatospora purpeofusca]|uniref:hypothetical protein n=1 Tax=Kitasatospora purpeofusca TaxID=67352 RepID=UPI0036CE2F11
MEEAETQKARLIQYFIALPETLPIPDGTSVSGTPSLPGYDGPEVILTFHQVKRPSQFTASLEAVNSVMGSYNNQADAPATPPPNIETDHTVVSAVTLARTAEIIGTFDHPHDMPPMDDSFNRCLHFISDIARSYRVAFSTPSKIPTYEQLMTIIPYSLGDPQGSAVTEGPGIQRIAWSPGGLMILKNRGLPGFDGPWLSDDSYERIDYFLNLLQDGNPFFLWQEWLQEAHRALMVDGNYSLAVSLASTASEVFLDGLLSLLLWESGESPAAAASRFEEGKITKRLKSQFPPFLGGSWSLDGAGPVAAWFRDSFLLRHRVVHGGYRPSRLEAATAVRRVRELETFCCDRLVERRGNFPRSVLMTIAESGLQQRGLWGGSIKKFSETVAPKESSWLKSFHQWKQEFDSALESQD